jgi:hypothetical protein
MVDAGDICGSINVTLQPEIPTVTLVVDQSLSMETALGSTTRWEAVRSALIARDGGLVTDLQDIVRFGLVLYTSTASAPQCPSLSVVTPALHNRDAMAAVYEPAVPLDNTPTGEAVRGTTDLLVALGEPGRKVMVIATDGAPDTCADPNPSTPEGKAAARALSVQEVARAHGLGIRTLVISVGQGSVATQHLQDVANAGVGGGPNAPYWEAGDVQALRAALVTTVGSSLTCLVPVNGQVDVAWACLGAVRLNGRLLTCNGADGWRAVDASHIELTGAACDELLSGAPVDLRAEFPCEVFIPG